MKRKIAWLGVSWLIVAALVLASCAPAAGEEEEEEEEFPTLIIGETFESPGVVVTASEAIITDSYEYPDKASDGMLTKKARSGRTFLILYIEMENTGSISRNTDGRGRFSAYDSEDNRYAPRTYIGENRFETVSLLAVGMKIEGKIIFEIQEGATDLRIVYQGEQPLREPIVEWVIE